MVMTLLGKRWDAGGSASLGLRWGNVRVTCVACWAASAGRVPPFEVVLKRGDAREESK